MKKFMAFLSIFIFIIVFYSLSLSGEETVVMDSGLKYKDLKIGAGVTAAVESVVVIHIVGWLDDSGQKGKKFISSHDRGKPVSFKLGTGKVMQGWNIGVAGMKVGGKRRLLIPSKLGYGRKGVDNIVPPNADLIFEVELLEVK